MQRVSYKCFEFLIIALKRVKIRRSKKVVLNARGAQNNNLKIKGPAECIYLTMELTKRKEKCRVH